MSEVSFSVKPDALALVRDIAIEANFDECKAGLIEMTEPYRAMVVTDETVADAKADRAKLRKIAAQIDDMRKTVKRVYSAPVVEFERRVKELTSIIDGGVNNLDAQVKAIEEREREAKLAELRAYYEEGEEEPRQYLTWERVYNPSWGNKGFALSTAKDETNAALEKTEQDIISIREVGGDDTPYLLDYYKQTLDICATMRKYFELKAFREREAERKKYEDGAQKYADQHSETTTTPDPDPASTITAIKGTELVKIVFQVTCTKAQLSALGQYMRSNGIRYGKPN